MFTQYQNYVQKNVGTATVTLVTCPAGQQLVINQLNCANLLSTASVTVSVMVSRSGTELFIVRNATVPPGGSLACAGKDQKIVLMAGDLIRVQSSAANSIDAVASGLLNDFASGASVPAVSTGGTASFSITPSATTVYEGGTITYNITTANVPNGTVLYWQNLGSLEGSDFTDGLNQGEVVINSNAGSFTRTLVSTDLIGEGSENIVMALRFGAPPLGGVMAVAPTVTVRDSVITRGLILHLDASNPASYPGSGATWTDISGSGNNVTLQNGPTFSNGVLVFNGTNQWARTAANLDLSTYDSVTVEIIVKKTNPLSGGLVWEHTANWNVNTGGIGLALHSNGTGDQLNVHHTNHNTSVARNYEFSMDTNWAVHTNIYSRINDETGRLTYVNGQRIPFSPVNGYATGTATLSGTSLANSLLYLATRGGVAAFFTGQIAEVKIYNRKLTDQEIEQNYRSAQLSRFGV